MRYDHEGLELGLATREAATATFALEGPRGPLLASGRAAALPAGPLETFADRASAFFRREAAPGPALLVGALPFDPQAHDHFYQPARCSDDRLSLPSGAPARMRGLSLTPLPPRHVHRAAIARAIESIARDPALQKVVLARSLAIETSTCIDPQALYARLGGDADVTRFVVPLPDDPAGTSRHLVGATPELLVSKRDDRVASFPLAGSRPRALPDGGDQLLASDKDRWEHRLVVEAIADTLAPHCADLSVPAEPGVCATRTMWHLGTRITGRLAHTEATTAAALVALLHPTPAVGGTPTRKALELIRALEPEARGFYAGALGWTDAAGDGDFFVALRCAEVAGASARIYAGGGIVAGSDPDAEVEETSAKFRAILDAFGIDEGGHARRAAPE